jgi:hypothetical protein
MSKKENNMTDYVTDNNMTDFVTDKVNTTTFLEPTEIVEFTLTLADGSSVKVPCTAVNTYGNNDATAILAAAIHHLIQRVEALEAPNEKEIKL